MLLWYYDIMILWYYDITIWYYDIMTLGYCNIMILWYYDFMILWYYVITLRYDHIIIWSYDPMGIIYDRPPVLGGGLRWQNSDSFNRVSVAASFGTHFWLQRFAPLTYSACRRASPSPSMRRCSKCAKMLNVWPRSSWRQMWPTTCRRTADYDSMILWYCDNIMIYILW